MTVTIDEHDWDGCLMCAVRTLTLGTPKNWGLDKDTLEPGASITGVVMRQGVQPSNYAGQVPYVDLWLGGIKRVRVAGHGMSLRNALEAAETEVGDTMTVTFEGTEEIQTGKMAGRSFRVFAIEMKRGHH